MNKNIVILSIFILTTFLSCDHYLDIEPKGVRLLETVEDYDLWLNSYYGFYPYEMNLLSDLSDKLDVSDPPVDVNSRVYTWQAQFDEDISSSTAPFWRTHYQFIYTLNAVIKNIDGASGGTTEEKIRLKSEALLGRGFEYLHLVNLYGKVYNPSTANQDLAVPFVTGIDVTDEIPNRSTVQEIYDHIIADITEALPNLPQDNSDNRFRGSIAAAYSVLARTYLYMKNYELAAINAQLAIDNSLDPILDYTEVLNMPEFPRLVKRPGTIYAKYGSTGIEFPTLDFLNSFEANDLRRTMNYTQPWSGPTPQRGEILFIHYGSWPISNAYPNWGTSVSEMRLILAETAARANNLEQAIEELHLLREKRFKPEDYVKYESLNQEDVLQRVLLERKFEFAFNGLRWYDMRRLASEGRMPEVYRYGADNTVISTLSPDSNRYTLQIPIQVMSFHPDWEQNP
ncbi:RagB/SusD family nutrient uptake outer membrane protein [Yeosuana marina]|uniref:RagB/SusD family nutrient uptake outer membrane protein n=1 Tax=Yeosuana marina TaxID=1565536 RepID=UPI0030EE2296